MSIGSLIRKKRTARGWSQYRLQEKSGVTRQAIANIEDNESSPTFTTLSKLLHALDVKAEELIGVLESETPQEKPRTLVDSPVGYQVTEEAT